MLTLLVGTANACSRDDVTEVSHQPTVAGQAVDYAMDDGKALGCDEFFSNGDPLFRVLELVQDQPAKQRFIIETHHDLGFVPIFAPVLRLARTAIDHRGSVLPADRPA